MTPSLVLAVVCRGTSGLYGWSPIFVPRLEAAVTGIVPIIDPLARLAPCFPAGAVAVVPGWLASGMTLWLHGLRTVIYPAPDLDAAKEWWTAILGLAPYFDQPFYVGYSVAGYELGLLPDADPADGALVYWGVDDVAEAVRDTVAVGAVEHTPASDVGDGIVTAAVRTPQGAVLGFIHNPHFQSP